METYPAIPELKTDSYVRVTVSLGPCPETFPVPNFTGMDVDEAISRLEGINCKGRGTSCPDQLSKALKQL